MHSQSAYRIRMDWGRVGATRVADGADIAVVVDVLSFTTTVSVCLDRGTEVFPYRWHDVEAAHYAARHDAVLARGRSAAGSGEVSLSPASVRAYDAPLARLVLPSPNGSTITHELAEGTSVLAASLRNAGAVGRWVSDTRPDATVAVVAAGERWPDGSLRPAVEDLWGAGAVLAGLPACGRSPEAQAAVDAWRGVGNVDNVAAALHGCASGRELAAMGFAEDVEIAAELDGSDAVPELREARFVRLR